MSVDVRVDPRLSMLLRALGALAPDGSFDPAWFGHPLDSIRHCLDDDSQRTAVFSLLDDALPPSPAPSAPSDAKWHPLLGDSAHGNVYLTVENGVVGVAADYATTWTDLPAVALTAALPLLRTGDGPAQAAVGPLDVAVSITVGAAGIRSIGATVSIGLDGTVALGVRLEDDAGAVSQFDPTAIDAAAVAAIENLVQAVLAYETAGDDAVRSLITHLPGLLGIGDAALTPLPIAQPDRVRAWFHDVVTAAPALQAWFGHLAGLLSIATAGLGAAQGPDVSGSGTVADPFRCAVLHTGTVTIEIVVAAAGTQAAPTLSAGVALSAPIGAGTLSVQAELLEVPVKGSAPATVLPAASALVSMPVSGGTAQAGVSWAGNHLVPVLRLNAVQIAGQPETVDLSDARSVVAAASDAVRNALIDAVGSDGRGHALLALLGFLAPTDDAQTPHLLSAGAFTGNPLTAIAQLHRAVLGDSTHPWSHIFAELGRLIGLANVAVEGDGTRQAPWRLPLAGDDTFGVALVAWDDRDATTPAGTALLRLGLQARLSEPGWSLAWNTEVLGFELRPAAPTVINLIGAQHVVLSCTNLPAVDTGDGFTASADSLDIGLRWLASHPADVSVELAGLTAQLGPETLGPIDLRLPGTVDPALPDVALPVTLDDAVAMLRTLLAQAWRAWGSDLRTSALAGLFGLNPDLPGAPPDWPSLVPTDAASLTELLADPVGALRSYLGAVLLDVGSDGTAHWQTFLRWLAAFVADQLPADPGDIPEPTVTGNGTYDDPWAVPLGIGDVDLLGWFDAVPPAGFGTTTPPRTTGQQLLDSLPATADELTDRDPVRYGYLLDTLDTWLAGGDGLVPYESQTAVPSNWTVGTALTCCHTAATADPTALTQTTAALSSWGSPAVLLVRTAARESWQAMLDAVAPGNDPDAVIDLRGDPDADLSTVTTVAAAYVLELDDPAPAAPDALTAQIIRAIERVHALTAKQVALIAHGPGGVAARSAVATTATDVAGVITICAPHNGSGLDPLSDAALADAVRLADVRAGDDAIAMLHAILDGGPATEGVLPPASTYSLARFAGVPAAITDTVPGLALAAKLPPGLVGRLAQAWQSPARTGATNFVSVGARTVRPLATAAAGDVAADLVLRVDGARFRIAAGDPPARGAHEITVTARIHRPGGWLVGDAGARAGGTAEQSRAELRARWVEIGALIGIDEAARLDVTPIVRLHDAGRPGSTVATMDLPDLLTALTTAPAQLTLPDLGDAATIVHDALDALGMLDGAGELVVDSLRRAADFPAATLGPQLPALIDVIAPAAGATASGAGWTLGLFNDAVHVSISPDPWQLHLTASADESSGLGALAGLEADATLTLPGFTAAGSAALTFGALRLASTGSSVSIAALPWLSEIVLVPTPDPVAVGNRVTQALPGLLLSLGLQVFAGAELPAGLHLPPLDKLLLHPADTLVETLGSAGRLDSGKINSLLQALGQEFGQPEADQGLSLPGGLALVARDPVALHLSGTITVDTTTLHPDLALALPAGTAPQPSGTLALTVELPGTWGQATITFGVGASGVTLSVAPESGSAIEILPRFDGAAALAGGLEALLPHVLQDLIDELPPTPVVAKVLQLAEALGIYDPSGGGFTGQAQQAQLAAMLQPGWLQTVASSAQSIATHIAELLSSPNLLPVPVGTLSASNSQVTWTVSFGAGSIAATLGWDAGGNPVVTLVVTDLEVGPLVVDSVTLGVGAQLAFDVTAHLALTGMLAPLGPALHVSESGGRFSVQVLPLGAGTTGIVLSLAPEIALTATPADLERLALDWGLPLASQLMVLAAADTGSQNSLLTRKLWTSGATAGEILHSAGLLQSPTSTAIVTPLPDVVDLVLGAASAAVTGVSAAVTPTLSLSLVHDTAGGRTGLRLAGHLDIDPTISVRMGTQPWLTEADDGVTVWIVENVPGAHPAFRLTPGLDATGLGLVLSGSPLVDGSLVIGGAGGLLFFSASFLDPTTRQLSVQLSNLGAGAVITSAFVALSADDGDSFIAKVLPPALQAPFDLLVTYRNGTLQVAGTGPAATGDITVDIPLDLDLAVIKITELLLGMQVGTGTLSLEAALSGDADVGPVYAGVERVGIIATFGTGGRGLRFRPPDKVALSIDSSTLRLSGFLLVDDANHRYIGAIEITVLGSFELTAIGIITTQLPDGSPGFSLLFIVSLVLPTPVALGYGFFFAGAGGLLGINRTIDLDALASGLRTGAAESILFPQDIARNADAIVRNLDAVFPVQENNFLIGPMAKITWGVPTLIAIELGLVIDIGTPLKIAIIGLLEAELPVPDAPVLVVKVAFVGAIDLGTSLLRFDASIYDSYIGVGDFKISLDGDIAVRLGWGAQPDFVASIGGFHPAYHPASYLHLPAMRRITLTLLRDNPSLVLTAYLAITANTVQFGTRLDFNFSVSDFSIVGDFGFDVLLQLSPFALDAHVYAHLAVKAGDDTIMGIDLDFRLTGPTPWLAHGTASFKVLFFSVDADFTVQVGQAQTNALTYTPAFDPVVAALDDAANWTAEFANPAGAAVSLAPIEPVTGHVVIDAVGTLSITQRVLPLATDISMVGTSKPSDVSRIDITGFTIGGVALTTAPHTELFSPAAFESLSDDDKLKDASFVARPAGITVAEGSDLHTDYVLSRPGVYDLIVADDVSETRTPGQTMDATTLTSLASGGATGRSAAAAAINRQKQQGSVLAVAKPAEAYAITTISDLRARRADGRVATPADTEVVTDRFTAEQRARAAGPAYQVLPASQVIM